MADHKKWFLVISIIQVDIVFKIATILEKVSAFKTDIYYLEQNLYMPKLHVLFTYFYDVI